MSGYKLEQAMSAAQQALAAAGDDIDEQLRRDTIEGQSDALELLDRYAEQALADKKLAEMATERARRLEARAEKHRAVVRAMLEGLGLQEPLQRALYTASLSYHRELQVTDADALPDYFIRHAPDKIAIAKALRSGEEIPGATLGNAQPRLTLRTS